MHKPRVKKAFRKELTDKEAGPDPGPTLGTPALHRPQNKASCTWRQTREALLHLMPDSRVLRFRKRCFQVGWKKTPPCQKLLAEDFTGTGATLLTFLYALHLREEAQAALLIGDLKEPLGCLVTLDPHLAACFKHTPWSAQAGSQSHHASQPASRCCL